MCVCRALTDSSGGRTSGEDVRVAGIELSAGLSGQLFLRHLYYLLRDRDLQK